MVLIDHSLRDRRVAVDSPVPQKRPIAARLFNQAQVDFSDQNFFLVVRSFGDHAAKGIAQKRSAPELQSSAGGRIAANVASFKPHTIDDAYINTIGDGVCPLNGPPCIMLSGAELGFLSGMRADSCRIKKNARPL